MKKVWFALLAIMLIGNLNYVYCKNLPNVVFMTFSDNTTYKKINSPQIFSDLLLDRISEIEAFNLIEHGYDEGAIEAEKRLTVDEGTTKKAIENNDFAYMYTLGENDINQKEAGDTVPIGDIKVIGKKHRANYVLHGSVDYLGSGIKQNGDIGIGISTKNPYIEAHVTVRIIRVADGKVVWVKEVKGVGKDTYVETKFISGGTEDLHSELFYEALEKACKKLIKEISDDIEDGKLVIR